MSNKTKLAKTKRSKGGLRSKLALLYKKFKKGKK